MWEQALNWIQDKLNDQVFEAWFTPVELKEIDGDTLTLNVPNKFFKEWLSNNYLDLIEEAVLVETGKRLSVRFDVVENGGVGSGQARRRQDRNVFRIPGAASPIEGSCEGWVALSPAGGCG